MGLRCVNCKTWPSSFSPPPYGKQRKSRYPIPLRAAHNRPINEDTDDDLRCYWWKRSPLLESIYSVSAWARPQRSCERVAYTSGAMEICNFEDLSSILQRSIRNSLIVPEISEHRCQT